jgi:hypothetical protein
MLENRIFQHVAKKRQNFSHSDHSSLSAGGRSKKKAKDWITRGRKSIKGEDEVLNLINDDVEEEKVLELLGERISLPSSCRKDI